MAVKIKHNISNEYELKLILPIHIKTQKKNDEKVTYTYLISLSILYSILYIYIYSMLISTLFQYLKVPIRYIMLYTMIISVYLSENRVKSQQPIRTWIVTFELNFQIKYLLPNLKCETLSSISRELLVKCKMSSNNKVKSVWNNLIFQINICSCQMAFYKNLTRDTRKCSIFLIC